MLRRELRGLVRSPLAGGVGALFLFLAAALNYLNLMDYLRANAQLAGRFRLLNLEPEWLDFNAFLLRQDLGALAMLALIFLPLWGMGLLADERRSGTLELIMTSPLGEGALVLGKWLGALLGYLLLLVLALAGVGLLALHGPLHWPTLLLGGLGLALLGGAFLSLILFIGSLTRSALLAASGGFALMLLLWLTEGFAKPGATGFPGGFLTSLSTMGHLLPLLSGLADSTDIVYFLVVAVLGLELTRLSLKGLRAGRRAWAQPLLRGAAICLLGGLLVFAAGRHPWRWDLSPDDSHSLSPRTLAILDAIEGPVEIELYFPDREPERGRVGAVLGALAAGRPGIGWELVDPAQAPARALAAGVSEPGTVVLRGGGREERFVAATDAQGAYAVAERQLALALQSLLREERARLRVAQGPGLHRLDDPAGFAALRQLLEFVGFRVAAWDLLAAPGGLVPAGTDLLLIPGPHRRLPEPVLAGVADYLAGGGAILLLLDPAAEMADGDPAAGLGGLLATRGLTAGDGYVVDLGEENINLGKGFEVPVVTRWARHPVTRAFQRAPAPVAFPLARALDPVEGFEPMPHALALSSDQSFEERGAFDGHAHFDPGEDRGGPLVLAALSDSAKTGGGPLLVVGDSHFATGPHVDWEGNAEFLLGAVAYLGAETERLAPGPERRPGVLLIIGQKERRLHAAVTMGALPLLLVALWPLRPLLRRLRRGGGS